jgi:hypothetical protein
MSIMDTVKADLGKVAHAFVVGAEKLKLAVTGAASEIDKLKPEIAIAEGIANSVANAIYPGSGVVLAAIESALGRVFDAVDAAGEAGTANGLNISLDIATVNAIKAALPHVKAQAMTTPGS